MLLVTGITGHTGRYFLQELIHNNYKGPIRCVVRESSDTSLIEKSNLNIENVVGNLDDPNFIYRVMDGIDTVMHIYNIHHSTLIVRAANENKVRRAILIHTTGIYSEFKYASEGYKKVEEKITEMKNNQENSTSITILRPSMIYGDLCDRNMSKFIKLLDKLKFMPVINGGNSLIQPVNVRDLGKALYTVLVSPQITNGKNYDLTGKRPIKMINAFKLISKELNKKTIYLNVPMSLGVLAAKIIKMVTAGKVDYVERVQRMGEDRNYSHENAAQDFNYDPMPFEKGIQIEVQEYLKEK
ncbi:NAD(P)H-binding protein [Jeotgalibacillus sp. ET6]|uniref:SDR family oxidoreductase n=1 Tax=Jeotgalibacillus sp. ET6 TaxID=3037260 RepID=UPI00241890F0|nr:NAD(P)H-binding protein [Jeotgalibacillus sp. ET6]MDG5471361.1 NAD(P)H-binding protein [Jeotgalibacillus sp. ET6]